MDANYKTSCNPKARNVLNGPKGKCDRQNLTLEAEFPPIAAVFPLGWNHLAVTASLLGCLIWSGLPAAASDKGWAAVHQVDPNSYRSFLNNSLYALRGNDRGFFPDVDYDAARDHIRDLLMQYGWSVTYDEFDPFVIHNGNNIIATKAGTVADEYIMGAHYDAFEDLLHTDYRYPGADDNASGVAALLEIARILGPYDSHYTIRLIAFDWEEYHWGAENVYLLGSSHYAGNHASTHTKGMISLDMIAWNDPNNPKHAEIRGTKASAPIKNALAAAIAQYGFGLMPWVRGPDPYSDHAPFEADGYQACLLTENEGNARYHTTEDCYENISTSDISYAVNMTRGALGWLVDNAHVDVPVNMLKFTYPNGRPDFSDPRGGTRVHVVVSGVGFVTPQLGTGWAHFKVGTVTLHAAMYQVEPNVYEALFPSEPCGTHIKYWFTVSAIGGDGYADPPAGQDAPYVATAGFGRVSVPFDWSDAMRADALWEWGHPTGQCGDPTIDHDVWGYNLDGCYENDLGARYLEFWNIDCSGRQDVHVAFRRWLNVEAPGPAEPYAPWDSASVNVSDNHANWTIAWENNVEVGDTQWVDTDLDVSAVADGKPAVFLRWTMGPTDSDRACGGWNIDNVVITAIDCVPPPRGDMNCDGYVNGLDMQAFVLALIAPSEYASDFPSCFIMNGDINSDQVVNVNDVSAFINCLLNGGCP